jgi:uncharacterized protein YunC (DUF1805 family)
MKSIDVQINGSTLTGLEMPLGKAPLVLVSAKNGFVMCGYLSLETAERVGAAAAIVRGVNSVDDLLNGKVDGITSAAAKLGVTPAMTGRQALSKLL